jgi:hypothetical protein
MNKGTIIEVVLLNIAFATGGRQLFNTVSGCMDNKISRKMPLRGTNLVAFFI